MRNFSTIHHKISNENNGRIGGKAIGVTGGVIASDQFLLIK
jgi:hypothetical protein